MVPTWFKFLRNDMAGGAVSAAVAIPLALGYGMFAFVALGGAYFVHGVVAGLLSASVVGFVATLFKDKSKAIYAPRIVTTFFIGALLRGLVNSNAEIFAGADVELTVTVLLLVILLAGAFQLLFGWIRLGSLLKHTPYPVLAGFQNAAAVLLFLVQVGNVLGFAKPAPITQLLANMPTLKPASLLVGVATFCIMWYAKRLLPKVPPVITGLAAGTLIYYLLLGGVGAQHMGPVIGPGQFFSFGLLAVPEFFHLARNPHFVQVLPMVLTGALGLAFIASLDALLCAKILEGGSSTQDESNRQLMRLGLGNMLSASMGGITSGLNLGPSLVNRAFGARTPLSVMINAAIVLLTICFLLPVLAYLPRTVLSAVIMVIAIQHLDATTLPLIRRLLTGRFSDRRAMALDLSVSLLVTVLAISVNIVAAVLVGIFVAMILFLLRISRSVVRTSYTCELMRSRKRRDPTDEAVLSEQGRHVHVLTLEGAIFFGSAERLLAYIDAIAAGGARCVIMDMGLVTDIDNTGARLMLEIFDKLRKRGITLLLSHLNPLSHGSQMLADVGLMAAIGEAHIFHDTDRALEWAENILIIAERGKFAEQQRLLDQQPLFDGLTAQETQLACAALGTRRFEPGDIVFKQGDHAEEMFIIARGSASVYVPDSRGGSTRLVTFAPGTVFGEVAIFDRKPRSATVIADNDLHCYVLADSAFESLKCQSPSVAIQMLINLGAQMATNLRNSNRIVFQLNH
jgi:SulP family sulfate permease